MYDLIIRGGLIVDGSGGEPYRGDVAITGERIAAVGELVGGAKRTIDAQGRWVTPGWVDIHTHYDGQATWDPQLSPSCWHGVTTVVMGNCGVGFAPVRPGSEEWLIGLMEGVEDIPGTALSVGMTWGWESFPEYLDALERTPRIMDVGAQIPHGAVRAYVMGERGARNEDATDADIESMSKLVGEALQAGALGFTTSRTLAHRAIDGEPVPGTFAAEAELLGIAGALESTGKGLFELAPAGVMGEDLAAPEKEVAWMRKVARKAGCKVSFALIQHDLDPEQWRTIIGMCEEANAAGEQLVPQVGSRPTMLLVGFQTFHPWSNKPTYKAIADWPLERRVAELRKPEVRARLMSEEPVDQDPMLDFVFSNMKKIFPLGDPPDYEPPVEKSVAALAAREGRDELDVVYDLMLDLDGGNLLMVALLGYSHGDLEAIREMLESPCSVFGLGDGGAHSGQICDASMTTFLLSHWVQTRSRGPRLSLQSAVRKMTRDTAQLYGLNDRGRIERGYRADLNVIDPARLTLHLPHLVHDLPAGAKRLIQRASGYTHTLVAGQVTLVDGEPTGALPGRLIRGAQPAPSG